MNGKILLITVLSFATLCLAVPASTNSNKWSTSQQYVTKRSSNEVENILSRWCESSKMSTNIVTESFKQLTSSLKDVSSRQLDQLTDDIIVKERFCKEHFKQQNELEADYNNEDLIKDVYLDALVACESSETTEQLVRAIDTGKVDSIRANYYLTLLAVSFDGEKQSTTTDSENDVAQKLTQSLLSKQLTGSSADNSLVETIERQKMFAATSVWSKKIQQQKQADLSPMDRSKVEQLVEAIVERYIKPVPIGQATKTTTVTKKQLADRDAALKALANIPCFVLPQKTIQLLLELALNKSELLSVRQTAIESLRDCSRQQDQQLKIRQQLKQLALTSTHEEPVEVRIVAYRQLVQTIDSLIDESAVVSFDELIRFINDETKETKDVQFVVYCVSHLQNLLKQADKKQYELLKKEKPQQLAQLKVASKRMQKYQDLRKYSRNIQLEQSLAKLESGLIFDADVIYERSQYLPKQMRLNVSMPVMGKTVELVEVQVRQNNMQSELLTILKPLQSTKINMESIDKVVSGIKKAATEYERQQPQQQQPELDLSIKMDGCTVMYVSLNDFKQQQQQIKQNPRLTRAVKRSDSYSEEDLYNSRESGNIIEDLLKQLKKSLLFNRGVHFHLNKRLGGLVDLQTTLTGNVRIESKVRNLNNGVYELMAQLQPRFAFESVIGLSKQTKNGKKLLQRISTESSIGVRMTYKQDELIELNLDMPMEEMELFRVESQLVEQVDISSTGLPIYKYSVEVDDDDYNRYHQKDCELTNSCQSRNKYNNVDASDESSSQWQVKSQEEKDKLIRFYGEDIEQYYGETMKNIRERRNLDKQSEIRQRFEVPEKLTKLTGLDGRVEFVASPKDLSGIVRVVIKKIDPRMKGVRMVVQTTKLSPSSRAYTIAFSTPRTSESQQQQQQQQDRLVQLRLVKDIKSDLKTLKGEFTGPVFEPMRFVVSLKDDGRKNSLEVELSCGGQKPWTTKFECGAIEQQQQQQQSRLTGEQQQQSTYKTYARVLLPQRSQPIELVGLVSITYKPKTSIAYEIKVPQELIEMIAENDSFKTISADKQTIKGRLTISSERPEDSPIFRVVTRDLKSKSRQLLKMLQENELSISNDVDVKLANLSYKCLTHFGVKPQKAHVVFSHNVDYLSSTQKMEQYRFDLELQNKIHKQGRDVEQLILVQQFNTKYPKFDRVFKLEHKTLKQQQQPTQAGKQQQQFTFKYLYPSEDYMQQVRYLIKSGQDKTTTMQQRQQQLSALEYSHQYQYVTLKNMQVMVRLVASPVKINREISFQVNSQKQQKSQSFIKLISEPDTIRGMIVVKDMRKQREELNAMFKFDQYFETKGQIQMMVRADLMNKKHSVELRHDIQRQQSVGDLLLKNLFKLVIDNEEPIVFDYLVRQNYQQQQQQLSENSRLIDYVIEGTLKDKRSPTPVPVRASTQLSYVNGFEFVQKLDCPERQVAMQLLVSEIKQVFKFNLNTRSLKSDIVGDFKEMNKQELIVMVQYEPKQFQHKTRIVLNKPSQSIMVDSQQVKGQRQVYKLTSELSSPIDLEYMVSEIQPTIASYWSPTQSYNKKRSPVLAKRSSPSYKRSSSSFLPILWRQQQTYCYVKCEYDQSRGLFQMEYKPVEEKFIVVIKDDKRDIYHKTLVEITSRQTSPMKMFVIESQTMKSQNQELVCKLDIQLPILTSVKSLSRCEQPLKVTILTPAFYNVQMEFEPIRSTFSYLLKKGDKFERTLEWINQRVDEQQQQQRESFVYPEIVRELVKLMGDKVEEQKFMIDAKSYPQVKLVMEISSDKSSQQKKWCTLGADIWLDQQQASSVAWQLGDRFSSESKWQLVDTDNNSESTTTTGNKQQLRFNSELKDLVKRQRYHVDALLSRQDKSHVTIETPIYSGEFDLVPLEQRVRLNMQSRRQQENSEPKWQLESTFDRELLADKQQYVRRARTVYKSKRELQSHSFDYNPIEEQVKFSSERRPIDSSAAPLRHSWNAVGELNKRDLMPQITIKREQSQPTMAKRRESYLTFKHNDDFDGSIRMRPFLDSLQQQRVVVDDASNDYSNDRFVDVSLRCRHPKMPFETTTRLVKREAGLSKGESKYNVFMKHMSRDQLVALLDIELEKKQKLEKEVAQLKKRTGGDQQETDEQEDEDDQGNFETRAKIHVKSDKHGHAKWEHNWNKQLQQQHHSINNNKQQQLREREDRFKFDLGLNKQFNNLKHKTEFVLQRQMNVDEDSNDDDDDYSSSKSHQYRRHHQEQKKRAALKKRDTESADDDENDDDVFYPVTRKYNFNMFAKSDTQYKKRDVYQLDVDYNQMYNKRQQQLNKQSSFVAKPNLLKLVAFEFETEIEHNPMTHLQWKLTTPQQLHHYTRYERPSKFVRKLSSKMINKQGEEMYSFDTQVPVKYVQRPFRSIRSLLLLKSDKCQSRHCIGKRSTFDKQQQREFVPTRVQYQDRWGKKFNFDMDMDDEEEMTNNSNNNKQQREKYLTLSMEDAKSGYEHSTKYSSSNKQQQQQQHYLKTMTRSSRFGQIVSFEVEAANERQMSIRFETPVVKGELSGDRVKRGIQQLKLRLQQNNQQQQQQQQQYTKEQMKQLRSLMGSFSPLLERQFYHETELLINELEQYYKVRTQTLVNQVQLLDLLLETKSKQQSVMKLSTKQSMFEVKLDQQMPKFEAHMDYKQKRVQHDTIIYVRQQQDGEQQQQPLWIVDSRTLYQGKQLMKVTGELVKHCTVRRQQEQERDNTDCKSQLMGQLMEDRLAFVVEFDHLNQVLLAKLEDNYRKQVHLFKCNYLDSVSVRPLLDLDYSLTAIGNQQQQELVYQGEARLVLEDLVPGFYARRQQRQVLGGQQQQQPIIVNELKFLVKPKIADKSQMLQVKYLPKRSFELNLISEPHQFTHITKCELPLAMSSVSQQPIEPLSHLLKQVKLVSRQDCLYSEQCQKRMSYEMKCNYDLDNKSTVSWKSPKATLMFELSPPVLSGGQYGQRSGEIVLNTRLFDHQSQFQFNKQMKHFQIVSSHALNKQQQQHHSRQPQVYEMEANVFLTKRQPTVVVVRSPVSQYQLDTQMFSGVPTLIMRYDNELLNRRHELAYESPIDSRYKRHTLRLTRGVRVPMTVSQQQQQQQSPLRKVYTIDSNDKDSFESLDFVLDNSDIKQSSHVQYESPMYKARLNYKPEQRLLNAKYQRVKDDFEHETDIFFDKDSTTTTTTTLMPVSIRSKAKRGARSLYQSSYANKDNKRHTFEHESHGYEVRMSVDPRSNELVMDIVTPENRRQHTEIVLPSRLQPTQYLMKSYLKTAQGTEVYSLDGSYVKEMKKLQAIYRAFPSKQYQMEFDGLVKRASIHSQQFNMDCRQAECKLQYECPRTKETLNGRVRFNVAQLDDMMVTDRQWTGQVLPILATFEQSTGEEMVIRVGQQQVFVMMLNKQKKPEFTGELRANLVNKTMGLKMEYDEQKMATLLNRIERKFAKSSMMPIMRDMTKFLDIFRENFLEQLKDGKTVVQLKDVSQLMEQLYQQIHDQCSRQANLRQCLMAKEYLKDAKRTLVRTSDKLMDQVEKFFYEIPMFKRLVKKLSDCFDKIKKTFDEQLQQTSQGNVTKYQQQQLLKQYWPVSVKSALVQFVDFLLDVTMYQSESSYFTSKPGYFAMQLSPEHIL